MVDIELERPLVHMPRFGSGPWLNTPHPLTREALRGQVVLVDFWDYSCVNCLRTLPYLRVWHQRYQEKGLALIGVHAPEFAFGRVAGEVAAAVEALEIPYPVLLDNDYQSWDRFANRAWPGKHLFDAQGYLRLRREGEGHYQEMERAIQRLLLQRDPAVLLPELLPPLRAEDATGAVCYRPTPELHAGYRAGLFGSALGNEGGFVPGTAIAYTLPGPFDLEEGYFYLAGFWRAEAEAVVFAGQEIGRVVLPYEAVGVNAVLSPSDDPVALMLDLRASEAEPLVEVRHDDAPLAPAQAGDDIFFEEGRAFVRVDRPRMYRLVRNPTFGDHQLELIFRASGMALYAFTFTSCVAAAGDEGRASTYRIQ